MERFFELEDKKVFRKNNIKLPSKEEVLKVVMPEVKEMYQKFKKSNKFYDYITIHIPMNTPPYVQDLREVDKSPHGTYEFIEDWAKEYTGDKGAFFSPITFEDEILEIVEERIENIIGVEILVDYNIYTGEAEEELLGEILGKPIFKLNNESKFSEKLMA